MTVEVPIGSNQGGQTTSVEDYLEWVNEIVSTRDQFIPDHVYRPENNQPSDAIRVQALADAMEVETDFNLYARRLDTTSDDPIQLVTIDLNQEQADVFLTSIATAGATIMEDLNDPTAFNNIFPSYLDGAAASHCIGISEQVMSEVDVIGGGIWASTPGVYAMYVYTVLGLKAVDDQFGINPSDIRVASVPFSKFFDDMVKFYSVAPDWAFTTGQRDHIFSRPYMWEPKFVWRGPNQYSVVLPDLHTI